MLGRDVTTNAPDDISVTDDGKVRLMRLMAALHIIP